MKTSTVEVIKITPELASDWLANKWKAQRNVRLGFVKKLASDMRAGRFLLSPDAIVRVKGMLANGQHRLSAVIESGKPQSFLVMETNDEELYKVIDCGLKRLVGDGLVGIPDANKVASIARWVWTYENQRVSADHEFASSYKSSSLSQAEMIDYCNSNSEELIEATKFVDPLYRKTRLLPCSISGALYVIGGRKNKEKTRMFIESVYIGGDVSSATDLRNRLIVNQGAKAKLNQGYMFALSIKSLRGFMNGTRSGTLKMVDGEKFPEL